MRSLTAGELATLLGLDRVVTYRVKVKNGSGTYVDLTSWVESVDWDHDQDMPVSGCTITFSRALGTIQSLAPFRSDSTLNRLDDNVTYSPLLDLTRSTTIEVATTAPGASILSGDYKMLFVGTISINSSANNPVVVTGRDLGGQLVDDWVQVETAYGSGPGIALETVMQTVLNDWAAGVSLYTPTSPSYLISPAFRNQRQSVMDALLVLAQLPGWDIRYKWDSGTSAFRLTLYQPDRTKTIPDYTLGSADYIGISTLDLELTDVRNLLILSYPTVTGVRATATVSDATSIIRYGGPSARPRFLYIQEPDNSPVNTSGEAATLLAAALADLKDPKAQVEAELPFFWPVELGDLLRFKANGIHFDTDQDWAVVSIKHSLSRNHHRTILRLRGKPAGQYINWIERSGVAGGVTDWTEGTPRRAQPYDDNGFAMGASENNGMTKVSTHLAPQGSTVPTPIALTPFSYNAGGPTSGDMWIVFTWVAITIYKPDGTTFSVPASTSLPAPPTPTLSQVAGGALAARTRFVRIGYVKNKMVYRIGAEASIALSANNLLKVTSPASVAGYDGWIPIVGSAANGEYFQTPNPGSIAVPMAFGSDYTEPAGGINLFGTQYENTFMPVGVTATALTASTTYYYYPWWEIDNAFLAFQGNNHTAKTPVAANSQTSDGRVALSDGAMSALTPAAGVGGSGSTGGGKFL